MGTGFKILAILGALLLPATAASQTCQEWPATYDPYASNSLVYAGGTRLTKFLALENGPGFILTVGQERDPFGPTPMYLVALETAYPAGQAYTYLDHILMDMPVEDISIVYDTAYLTAGGTDMVIVDVTDPSALAIAGTMTLGGACRDMLIDFGRELLITAEWDAIRFYSIAQPTNPTLVGSVPAAQAAGIARSGNLILVASSSQGLRVINASDPANPVQIAQIPVGGSVRSVAVWQDRALLAGPYVGLVEVDISNPAVPVYRGAVACTGEAEQVVVSQGYAYVRSERVEPMGTIFLDDLHLFRLTLTQGPLLTGTYFHQDLAELEPAGDRLLMATGDQINGIMSVLPQCAPVSDVPDLSLGRLHLAAPEPNPFNPSVGVAFSLPDGQPGSLAVFDLQGRRVHTLWSGVGDGGLATARWNGRFSDGRAAASGTYLFVLRDETTGVLKLRRASLLK